jgi:hypothetical protein
MNPKVKKILELQDERRSRNRLRRLFPNTPTPKTEYSAAPEEGMKGLLGDINEFDDQHAEFVRDLGMKHT